MRNDLFGAIIAERQHRAAALPGFGIIGRHHRRRALGDRGEAVDADVHGHQKIFEPDIGIGAAQRLLVRIADGVDDEVDRGPARRERGKGLVEIGHVADVAIDQEIAAELVGERLHPLFHHLALIGNGKFGALRMQGLRDAPGKRLVVRKPHDQPALSLHQPHVILRSCRYRPQYRRRAQ